MYLSRARVFEVAPFGDAVFPFCDEEGLPRLLTVVHGSAGVGKTALLQVVSGTRPGHANALYGLAGLGPGKHPHAVCHWTLGDDDPKRPHDLEVASPNVQFPGDPDLASLRRKEQALFERKAREGGYAFLALSAARWFSRQPVAVHAPLRTIARYDVRAGTSLDDASKADLTRDTKMALAYAAISSALTPDSKPERSRQRQRSRRVQDMRVLGSTMREVVGSLAALAGFRYLGVEPTSLEPIFSGTSGRVSLFEQLPTPARHLVAFAALPVRLLWAAYPGKDPRLAEGVVAIDQIDLHQDPVTQERVVPTLRDALPRVQWILTTSSPSVAASCESDEVLALRRLPEDDRVEVFVDAEARTH